MPAVTSQPAPVSKLPPANQPSTIHRINPKTLRANDLSRSIYGDPSDETEDLKESIREHGILVPLVVAPGLQSGQWEILSGHRRWACALALGLPEIPCEIRRVHSETTRRRLILEYNRQRAKTFSQLMRESDVLEELLGEQARRRRMGNLWRGPQRKESCRAEIQDAECRNSDDRTDSPEAVGRSAGKQGKQGRTDTVIAQQLGLGGKDLYRQARAIWHKAREGDVRARSGVAQLDAGTKTIHAAYKDLRRRDRFTTSFRPTPYDVWAFRHDRAFGIPHPGSIPPAIVAHALHYFCPPGGLVVDPMAGGGTTLDVCQSMGRRCFAYDLEPSRPDIDHHDIRVGFPAEAIGCDLIFCDPPYHTMLAQSTALRASPQLPGRIGLSFCIS